MSDIYNGLLKELGISKSPDSYETYRRLKEKRAEYMSRMGSQNSPEENQRLEQLLNAIGKAENHFEALAKEEKKANKWDGFDYDSLKGQKKKKKRVYVPSSGQEDSEDAASEPTFTFEERYDNIIGFMGTPDGFEVGLEQLKQLGEEGYVVAQRRLGWLYYDGEKSVAADNAEAFKWFEKAAMQGDAESQNKLGLMYKNGEGVEVNREEAIKWLKKADAGKFEYAAWNLGCLYDQCFDVKDYKEAAHWYEIAASEHGDADAYVRLGCIYMEHIPNREKVIYWLKKAYEAGDKDAAWNLAAVYEDLFEEKDYKEAAKWYEIAGNENGRADAYNNLGIIYAGDNGVGPDYEKAIYWLKKAYETGEKDAAWSLGVVYEELLAEKDYKEAAKWYEIAENEKGDTRAYSKLGYIYMVHIPNREKAIYWLKKAYEAGEKAAAWNLGLVYEDYFEEKDYEEAIKWYTKSATEKENERAMLELGKIYEEVKRDDGQAAHWYQKAIQYGSVDAQAMFDRLIAKVQSQNVAQNNKKEKEEKHGAGKFFARWKK